jgi:hypothetical protein
MDPLIKQVKWVTSIGHELTFLPTKEFSVRTQKAVFNIGTCDDDYYEEVERCVDVIRAKTRSGRIKRNDVHNDCGCIEISSEPLKNWKTFESWNNRVRKIAYTNGMTHKLSWNAGGMGHHHIDMQKDEVVDNLFKIVAARPYLSWMFVDPEDTKNCQTIASWYLHRHLMTNSFFGICDSYFDPRIGGNHSWPAGRGVSLSHRGDTIEWRAFDSAEDMTMQIEHTAFLQALVAYAQKTASLQYVQTYDTLHLFKNVTEAKKLLKKYQDPELCAKEFLEFIELIGLPKDRYERYIDMNLKPRLAWKKGV